MMLGTIVAPTAHGSWAIRKTPSDLLWQGVPLRQAWLKGDDLGFGSVRGAADSFGIRGFHAAQQPSPSGLGSLEKHEMARVVVRASQ